MATFSCTRLLIKCENRLFNLVTFTALTIRLSHEDSHIPAGDSLRGSLDARDPVIGAAISTCHNGHCTQCIVDRRHIATLRLTLLSRPRAVLLTASGTSLSGLSLKGLPRLVGDVTCRHAD